jgi:ribonuclease VapC
MIVVDSSAVVAILFDESSAAALLGRLETDPDRVMSVASYLETGTVLAGRRRSDRLQAIDDLDAFLDEAGIVLAPVDETQARVALQARIQFGRGMGHGGVLNFGDAFSYALARTRDAALLFTGDDFGTTDVIVALSSGQSRQPP